jgi:hypothetical protein
LRIFYLSDGLHAGGGRMVNLDHVEALRGFGYDARYLVVPAEGVEAPQFPLGRDVPWQTSTDDLTLDDIVVVGEMHAAGARAVMATPARKLIHNQNPYYSFLAFRDFGAVRGWGCEAMLAPSGFTADQLRQMGWTGPVHVVRPFVDPVFAAAAQRRDEVRIGVMPRKRPHELALIRGVVLSQRPDLARVPWGRIGGRPRAEVADILGRCDLFLSLSHMEGLGLPPLEAMAAGCLVVGFHGGGGREYATAENGDWFDDGGHLEIAAALIGRLDALAAGERFEARREAGRRTAAEFSLARFEAELRAAWLAIAGPP